ncbi:MAG TPA: SHOCT domain-containing protein [Verrucomicrobiae bacterium]|nr:SHOCT domain-containing protein [Verrucomicrobiae bacterium]
MKSNLIRQMALVTALAGLGLMVAGCAWQIGGDKKGTSIAQTTRGQELIDLKKAKDQGAISEEEYQAQRNKILNRQP